MSNLGRKRAVCTNDGKRAMHTGWDGSRHVWWCCDCFALHHPHPDNMHDEESMSSAYSEEAISALRQEADEAEARLRGAIESSCPGPHQPKQHRDYKPPWCEACGRTARGIQLHD